MNFGFVGEEEKTEREKELERIKQKEELKAKFNEDYDDKKSGVKEGRGKAREEESGDAYIKSVHEKFDLQAKLNLEEFAKDDPLIKAKIIGFEGGTYIRIQISCVPHEFVEKFNPKLPIIVGGLLSNENNLGFLQTRLKKHRWHRKILKSNDPFIVSLGWRRFQTVPLYSVADDAMRHRLLKYTPGSFLPSISLP